MFCEALIFVDIISVTLPTNLNVHENIVFFKKSLCQGMFEIYKLLPVRRVFQPHQMLPNFTLFAQLGSKNRLSVIHMSRIACFTIKAK